MTRTTGERLYRACQRCRERKSKCDLNCVGEPGRPPCLECFRTGHDCKLAGSRRGGNYTHLRKLRSKNRHSSDVSSPFRAPANRSPSKARQATVSSVDESSEYNPNTEPICSELRNPFDALQILAKAAVHDTGPSPDNSRIGMNAAPGDLFGLPDGSTLSGRDGVFAQDSGQNEPSALGIKDYELVKNGALQPETIPELLQLYLANYHPFIPLTPIHVLSPLNIDEVSVKEPFLLTAILTIASKDDPKWDVIHQHCWEYMKRLLLDVLLGLPPTQQVGSVEGLLLLSDWVPYIQFDKSTITGIPRGTIVTEDSTAWSLVGQAVRQAYLLRLDRTSFRETILGESKEEIGRKRLVWSFVYLADRQISVRMGQSFWSRGPSLSTRFTVSDFPTLQPASNTEDDYASVLQATLELTQLLHNMHDILYSSRTRTVEMMQRGDYSRYLDDFLKALMAWYELWGGLNVSSKLKSTLQLMYEYLCLYVNAFSFQSVISRASTSPSTVSMPTSSDSSQQSTFFPRGVMASPDGRFIHEAIRAAKMILKIFTEMDAVNDLRYMPSRFYLYGIYSAVFLNRADMFGALTMKEEHNEIVKLVQGFMSALETAARGEHHIGLRYSKLLKSLWFPGIVQKKVEIPQENVGGVNLRNIPIQNQQSGGDTPDFIEPGMLGMPHNIGLEVPMPAWVEASGFDPFCGSFSYIESDIFGMLPQNDIDIGM